MKFDDLKLTKSDKVVSIKINDKEVSVKQYLPISDKIDLVQIALQQSLEDGVYNDGLLTAYFNTYLVMFYSDLEFTDEQKEDILSIFDILDSTNSLGMILSAIPKKEIEDVTEMLNNQQKSNVIYKQSAAYLIGQFINALPEQMEKVGEIINDFDPSKYQAVVDFATAANGGRNINTNLPIEKTVEE